MDRDAILERKRLKRRLAVWRTLAIVSVVGLILFSGSKFYEKRPIKKDFIARVSINKVIFEDIRRERLLQSIATNEQIKGVILRINSPGGTITGSEALFLNLRRIAEKKPVVAVIGTVGASGGYIAAIGADRIYARETSLTGSIGVVFQTREFCGLMEKIGVRSENITSGRLKARPNSAEPMDGETRKYLQSLIDESMGWFINLVTERRKLKSDALPQVKTGRIFSGKQALNIGLVDALGGEREARQWLEKEKKLGKAIKVYDMAWQKKKSWLARIMKYVFSDILPEDWRALDGLVALWQPEGPGQR